MVTQLHQKDLSIPRDDFVFIAVIVGLDKVSNCSPERLGVRLALLGVDSSTVTVASVSSPGEMDVIDTSGGDSRSNADG